MLQTPASGDSLNDFGHDCGLFEKYFQEQMGENRKQIQNNTQELDNITIKRMTAAAQTTFTAEDGYSMHLYKQTF